LYFLLLGYSDPFALFLGWAFKLNINYTHLTISLFLAYAVLFYSNNINYKWVVSLFLCYLAAICLGIREIRYLTFIGFHILIFVQILISAIKEFYIKQRINVYFSVFLIYELTKILRYTIFIYSKNSPIYLFYLSDVFEMFICLFFILYNLENSPHIKLPFSKKYEY